MVLGSVCKVIVQSGLRFFAIVRAKTAVKIIAALLMREIMTRPKMASSMEAGKGQKPSKLFCNCSARAIRRWEKLMTHEAMLAWVSGRGRRDTMDGRL